MSPTRKTLVMAVIAAIMVAMAAFYYPWPETIAQSAILGKPLFKEYSYDKAKRLSITRFNEQSGQLEVIDIQLGKNGWVLPRFKNFPVTNNSQNSIAVNAFSDREVLLEETSEIERHQEYGVIDPTQYKTIADKSKLGIKVVAKGANDNELASLIIGQQLKESSENEFGERQYYVTIPGQPSVYVINLNPRAFPTEFSRWVDPNLFAIPFQPIPLDIAITKHLFPPEEFAKGKRQNIYRAELKGNATAPDADLRRELSTGRLELKRLSTPDKSGKLAEATIATDFSGNWNELLLSVRRIQFTGIRKKTAQLTSKFLKAVDDGAEEFEDLQTVGFLFEGYKNGVPQFETSNGNIELRFESGVRLKLLLGTIAVETTTEQNELNRHVMLLAEFDPELTARQEALGDDATEEEKKEFGRQERKREEVTKASRELVKAFNERHASWVYLVPETVCNRLVPDLDVSAAKLVAPETSEEKSADKKDENGESGEEKKSN